MPPAKPCHSITTPKAVAALLSSLLMRPIVAKRSTVGINLAVSSPTVIAQYPHDDGTYGALCMCDLPLAANLAACLSLVPAGVAQEAVRARSLPPDLMENFCEVMNICAQLFLQEGSAHVAYRGRIVFPGNIPDEVREVIFHPAGRLDLDIKIPSYGKGKMALRCA